MTKRVGRQNSIRSVFAPFLAVREVVRTAGMINVLIHADRLVESEKVASGAAALAHRPGDLVLRRSDARQFDASSCRKRRLKTCGKHPVVAASSRRPSRIKNTAASAGSRGSWTTSRSETRSSRTEHVTRHADHRFRSNQLKVSSPRSPTACNDRPEGAIFVVELRLRLPASADRELLAQDLSISRSLRERSVRLARPSGRRMYIRIDDPPVAKHHARTATDLGADGVLPPHGHHVDLGPPRMALEVQECRRCSRLGRV